MCTTVNIADFGVIPNIETIQTSKIQNAIDYCYTNGGGEVIIPSGTYITGDIRLRSNIKLHLMENAVLKGSLNTEDYTNIYNDKLEPLPEEHATKVKWVNALTHKANGGGLKKHLYTAGSYWNYGIIRAVFAENVSIIGEKGSLIDGGNLFDFNGEEDYRGPHGINMHFCKNLHFEGYTVKDTGNWAHAIFQSENITFKNLNVFGGHDALHTRACSDIKISDCKLITGDDCIAGFDCLDVHVKNCEISSACSAFRFGGNNILIEDCKIYGPCEYQFRGSFTAEEKRKSLNKSQIARNNMLCFFTYFVTDDLPTRKKPGKILLRNCIVENADRFLHINLSGNETWQRGNPPEDISFENINAKGIKTGLYAYGDGVVNFILNLKNINFYACEGFEAEPFIKAAHFKEININNLKFDNYNGNSFIRVWSDPGVVNVNTTAKINESELIVRANEDFLCSPI